MSNSSITLTSLANTLGISSLTEDTTPDAANDFVATYDASASANKKVKITNIPAGSMVLLATATASASATISFTSISSTYSSYRIIGSNIIPATDDTSLNTVVSIDGGSSYVAGTSYEWVNFIYSTSATGSKSTNNSAAVITLNGTAAGMTLGTGTGESFNFCLDLYNPSQAAAYHGMSWTGGGRMSGTEQCVVGGFGNYKAIDAVNAIRFLMSSGNIASGIFKLYGIKG